MAERFYGLDIGQTRKDVVEGSSTTATTDIEVRVDLAGVSAGNKGRMDVIQALEYIKQAIEEDTWPPA